MFHPNTPLADRVRADLIDWMARNKWTANAINVAMNRLHLKTMQCGRIEQFIARTYSPGPEVLRSFARFLRDYPSPGTLEDMRADLDAKAREEVERKNAALLSRRFAAERARMEHIRQHLEAEQAPRRGWERPFYMTKAEVSALSGGTL